MPLCGQPPEHGPTNGFMAANPPPWPSRSAACRARRGSTAHGADGDRENAVRSSGFLLGCVHRPGFRLPLCPDLGSTPRTGGPRTATHAPCPHSPHHGATPPGEHHRSPASCPDSPVRQLTQPDSLRNASSWNGTAGAASSGATVRVRVRQVPAVAAALWHGHATGRPIWRSPITSAHWSFRLIRRGGCVA